jgi:hypothetical protein
VGKLPLVGGSCVINSLCYRAPDAGNLVVLQRAADGEWTSRASTVPFYGYLHATTAADGSRFVLHYGPENGIAGPTGWHVYRVAADGALSPPWSPGAWQVGLPRASPSPPLLAQSNGFEVHVEAFPAGF